MDDKILAAKYKSVLKKVTHERLQAVNFGPPGWFSNGEINALKNSITLREKAIAFCQEERGLLKHSYGKPYKTQVIPHEPWQKKPIPIPKSILCQFTELMREGSRTGLHEQTTSSYTSPIFCVAKSNGKLRIVHGLQEINKVTIKDSGLPPHIEEFVDAFSGRECYGLGYIMGGYDERELDVTKRTLTTFETPLGRMQLTRLRQGATNLVAVYQAQMTWILQEEIPKSVGIFIDDGGIKGPRSLYNQETLPENPSIRRFLWEYAITLERILFRIEEAGLTISGSNFSYLQTKQERFCNRMQEYLSMMKKPESSKEEEFRRIKRRSPKFFLEDGQLKRRNNPNLQLVISSQEAQSYILKSLHKDMDHRGENEAYRVIEEKLWWEGVKKSVKKWVQSFLSCQKRSQNLQR
ncbi:hypothetical protein O181_081667 [Austropuccinia psidii MF-1]|uniref:Integrase zinc-binding domain-containing protein n=1 Tax=Austropuccinia psidii MF-1 TaxID=1389203 RepID=A0A9Q3FR53_9BASI|nr:hypothetical protein [Austropuccinia psidii MF-1]